MRQLLLCFGMAALALFASAPSFAQENQEKAPAADEAKVNVELIAAPVKPDEPVFVNSMLTNPAGERVRVIHEMLQFPGDKLSFNDAELGISGSLADSDLKVVMKDSSGTPTTSKSAAQALEVTISGKQTIPEGPLIEYEFRLKDTKEQKIKIPHTVQILD